MVVIYNNGILDTDELIRLYGGFELSVYKFGATKWNLGVILRCSSQNIFTFAPCLYSSENKEECDKLMFDILGGLCKGDGGIIDFRGYE